MSGLVTALIALGTAFGLDLSSEQVGAIMAFVGAVLAFAVRSQVTPTVKVSAERDFENNQDIAGEALAKDNPIVEESDPVVVIPTKITE